MAGKRLQPGSSQQKLDGWLISDEEEDEPVPNLIPEESVSDNEEPAAQAKVAFQPVHEVPLLVSVDDVEKEWWAKLVEEVPEKWQCRIANCRMAPPGHKCHLNPSRFFSIHEKRLIIQYLIHYDEILNGKGLKVWEDMHARGYMLHRSEQSLNNNFKRYILRDITMFKLPEHIENKFLELRN